MHDMTVKGSENGLLRYTRVESSKGGLLVVMSDRGVVDIILGESHEEALSNAASRFPGRAFVPDLGAHAEWTSAVARRIDMPRAGTTFPVDLTSGHESRATA